MRDRPDYNIAQTADLLTGTLLAKLARSVVKAAHLFSSGVSRN